MKKQQIISAAIIGTGNIAGGYDEKKVKGDKGVYSHAGAFRANGNIRLQTVYDTDLARSKTFAKIWKTRSAEKITEITRGYHDIVTICTPDNTHFRLVSELIKNKACKTICVEKPAAQSLPQLINLINLSRRAKINVAVNFQRAFDPSHAELAARLRKNPEKILAAQCVYIKGLEHIGVTMTDTLLRLFGMPCAVMALRRVFNRAIADYSYDFALYYPDFLVTVRTADSEQRDYSYHIFEIDILLADGRVSVIDNSRSIRTAKVAGYSYSGVKALDEKNTKLSPTQYSLSMKNFAGYLHAITTGGCQHTQNTLENSLLGMIVTNSVKESYRRGLLKISLPEEVWKK